MCLPIILDCQIKIIISTTVAKLDRIIYIPVGYIYYWFIVRNYSIKLLCWFQKIMFYNLQKRLIICLINITKLVHFWFPKVGRSLNTWVFLWIPNNVAYCTTSLSFAKICWQRSLHYENVFNFQKWILTYPIPLSF